MTIINPAAYDGGVYLSSVIADAVTGDFTYSYPVGVTSVTMVICDACWNCSEMSPKVDNSLSSHRTYLPLIVH